MNDTNKEQLSAFIDGELKNDPILDELINDQDMKDTWSRYHLIGDVLRDNLSESISNQVSNQVADALRDEPTVLAPVTKRFNFKPVAGFAIAASVAMMAVFSIQQGNENDPTLNATPSVAAINVSPAQSFDFPSAQVLPASVKQSDTPESLANQRLNNYLINHNEYRGNSSVNAILPYVRVITSEPQE